MSWRGLVDTMTLPGVGRLVVLGFLSSWPSRRWRGPSASSSGERMDWERAARPFGFAFLGLVTRDGAGGPDPPPGPPVRRAPADRRRAVLLVARLRRAGARRGHAGDCSLATLVVGVGQGLAQPDRSAACSRGSRPRASRGRSSARSPRRRRWRGWSATWSPTSCSAGATRRAVLGGRRDRRGRRWGCARSPCRRSRSLGGRAGGQGPGRADRLGDRRGRDRWLNPAGRPARSRSALADEVRGPTHARGRSRRGAIPGDGTAETGLHRGDFLLEVGRQSAVGVARDGRCRSR